MYTSYFINAVNWEKNLYRKERETDIDWEWDREEESIEKKRDKDLLDRETLILVKEHMNSMMENKGKMKQRRIT